MSLKGAWSTSQAQGAPYSGYDKINKGIVVTPRAAACLRTFPSITPVPAGMMKAAATCELEKGSCLQQIISSFSLVRLLDSRSRSDVFESDCVTTPDQGMANLTRMRFNLAGGSCMPAGKQSINRERSEVERSGGGLAAA